MDRRWVTHKELWAQYYLTHIKIIKPATSIGVSNLKYKIEKATLAMFGNNVKRPS